jgi:hypothetical protein
MCCFSRAVPFVGATKIFARDDDDGRQLLAYSMDVEIDEALAMVLPLPVPNASVEDAVRFIDLSAYPKFFDDLAAAFPPTFMPAPRGGAFQGVAIAGPLKVHDVGDFEASFVPRVADFARLDPRFRIPPALVSELPAYADYGFAVFRLKPLRGFFGKRKRQTVHPMAFSFPRRDERAIFFPTVHMHDGSVPEDASFDHALYGQLSPLLDALVGWTRSTASLGTHVDASRARGLVSADAHGLMTPLLGVMPNVDTWLREPADVALADLEGRGECFTYRVSARNAFTPPSKDPRLAAWRETAQTRLPQLCRGLPVALAAFESKSRDAFHLRPLSDDLAPHFLNGRQLWSGTSYMNGHPHAGGGRGRVQFTPFTKRIELQDVSLGFEELPNAERTEEILRALEAILDAVIAP